MIRVQHLSKIFPSPRGQVEALHDISFEVEKQDIYGIIGLSGAGKSTLMRCLAGLEAPSSGSITIHGRPLVPSYPPNERQRPPFGMIFQHFNLFSSRTVRENIAYPLEIHQVPAKERAHRTEELLQLVGLAHRADTYPQFLSGGEKQRTGIARALAIRPALLLCDEATSALDPKSTQQILQLLISLNQTLGLTLIVITHEMEVVRKICNKVAVLEGGKLVESGSVLDLFTAPKHPCSRHFVETMIPEAPLDALRSQDSTTVRLTFHGSSAREPLISRLIRQYSVEVNILLGSIHHLQDNLVGNLVLDLSGESGQVQEAIAFLRRHHVFVEEIAR